MRNDYVLFITRKYPPAKGGMESYSYNLITNYDAPKKVIALGKSQRNLIWFLPYTFFYVLINAPKFETIVLGDLLLCGVGWISKKRNKKIKVVTTLHGLDMTFSNKLYQWYLKHFSYGFDMYVPNSKYTMAVAEKRGYRPLECIPPATLNEKNTVFSDKNRDLFCKKYNIPTDAFVIATVGRLVKRKGVEWFIREVLSKCTNSKFVYIVAGEGPMRNSIEQTIADLSETRVIMAGRISDEDLSELYTNIDVFLMPNIYVENDVEGFGMVATEACAAGTLVVAADMQGIADAVENRINGLLFTPEDSEQLTIILNDICKNPEQFNYIKQNAIQYVTDHFTGDAVAKKYKAIISKISNT